MTMPKAAEPGVSRPPSKGQDEPFQHSSTEIAAKCPRCNPARLAARVEVEELDQRQADFTRGYQTELDRLMGRRP